MLKEYSKSEAKLEGNLTQTTIGAGIAVPSLISLLSSTTSAATNTAATTATTDATGAIILKVIALALGSGLAVAGAIGSAYAGIAYYKSNEAHYQRIKVDNYTNVFEHLYHQLLIKGWKGNNILIIALDNGKKSPGTYIEFYNQKAIDYENKKFDKDFNILLKQLKQHFKEKGINAEIKKVNSL